MTHATSEVPQESSYLWVVLAACIGMVAVAFNTTAMVTALPTMKSSLDLSVDTVQWVVNIYMLATATSLAAFGHLADMFGLLRIFFVGLAAFAIGTAAIAFADDAVLVLAGRAFQGIGAAGLMATAVAMISVASPEEKRSAGLGMFAASVALGFALGPVIGGLLIDNLGWRAILVADLFNIVVSAVVCIIVLRLKLVPRALETKTRIDFIGIALLVAGLGTFLLGLTSGQLTGWASARTISLFVCAAVSSVAFVVVESRTAHPLINFRFFRHADYVASTTAFFCLGFALIGMLLFVNLFLQSPDGLNFSAAKAGLALLPFTGAMLAVSLTAPRLLSPDALRMPATGALLMLALGFWLMRDPGSYGDMWWKFLFIGAGIGVGQSLLPRVGLRALPDASAGQGSGVITTCFYAGVATGTAVGGVVTSLVKRFDVAPAIAQLAPHDTSLHRLEVTLVHGSETQIAQAMAKLSPEHAKTLKTVMQTVYDSAFAAVMETMAAAALIGAVLCVLLIRKRS